MTTSFNFVLSLLTISGAEVLWYYPFNESSTDVDVAPGPTVILDGSSGALTHCPGGKSYCLDFLESGSITIPGASSPATDTRAYTQLVLRYNVRSPKLTGNGPPELNVQYAFNNSNNGGWMTQYSHTQSSQRLNDQQVSIPTNGDFLQIRFELVNIATAQHTYLNEVRLEGSTAAPSASPSNNPSQSPTTHEPTAVPSKSPTASPTPPRPTTSPTTAPPTTALPTASPTTAAPTASRAPTGVPTVSPTTPAPTTREPTGSPSEPPTDNPSQSPTPDGGAVPTISTVATTEDDDQGPGDDNQGAASTSFASSGAGIGTFVGVGVLVLIIVGVVIYFAVCKKKKNESDSNASQMHKNIHSTSNVNADGPVPTRTPPTTEMAGSGANPLTGDGQTRVPTHDFIDENEAGHDDEEKEAEYVTPGGPDLDDLDMEEDEDRKTDDDDLVLETGHVTMGGGGGDIVDDYKEDVEEQAVVAKGDDIELEMEDGNNNNGGEEHDSDEDLLMNPSSHVTMGGPDPDAIDLAEDDD
mmetsp:Transcript_34449/g.55262  ORF Transcript_34449/g.55262 Transcript_34449/m.55262 type:complete len:525 (-) Transcript_34449:336-1910(-)